jgi:threonine/homoserine/homoserine lactone efflux protein
VQPLDTLLVFFAASMLLALTPGPDNLFVLAQAARQGSLAGLTVTIGLCTGLLVHTTAVACGVAALVKTSALAFSLLKYVGAGYLLYLAYGAFRAGSSGVNGKQVEGLSYSRLYRRGIIMNVTNPKVSLFFLAFLPQFVDPAYGSVTLQIGLLGLLFIVATILVFGAVAILAGQIGGWLRKSDRAQAVLNRLAGFVFVGLALKLALADQS